MPDEASLYQQSPSKRLAYDIYHPAVVVAFGALVLIFSMIFVHPVYLAVSCLLALLTSFFLRGSSVTLRSLRWQIPLLMLITLVNPLMSSRGTLVLVHIGSFVLYTESLLYGLSMGMMLLSVVLWFVNLSAVLTIDDIGVLFGGALPTVSFMLMSIMRSVPRFLERGQQVARVQQAQTGVTQTSLVAVFRQRVRLVSILMAWSLEDSVDMADAMKARGWGGKRKPTRYQRRRFSLRDAVAFGALVLLAVANVFAYISISSAFEFYHNLFDSVSWWCYIPLALLCALPLLVGVFDAARWRLQTYSFAKEVKKHGTV